MRCLRSGIPAPLAGIRFGFLTFFAIAFLAVFAAPSAQAQISGDFTFDTNYNVFFIHGDTLIDGDLTQTGSFGVPTDVVVGKDDAVSFSTLTPITPIILTLTGAYDGSSGAITEYYGKLKVPSAGFAGGVAVYGNHIINVEGGYAYWINAHESSVVNVTGGYVPYLYTYDDVNAAILSGYVDYAIADGNSLIDISGGTLYRAAGFGASSLNIADGTFTDVYAFDDSFVNIGGGTMDTLTADNNSIVNIDGGSVTSLTSYANSLVSLGGGSLDDAILYDNSELDIFGGSINTISVFDDSLAVLLYDSVAVTPQSSFTEYNAVNKLVVVGTQFHVTGDLLFGDPLDATIKAGDYTDDGFSLTFTGPTAAPDLYVTDPTAVSGAYNSVVVGSSEDGSLQTSPIVTVNDSFVRDVYALNASDVTVTNSTINQYADAYNDATLRLVDSTAFDSLVTDNGSLIVDNSLVGVVQLEGNGAATLNSGHIDEVNMFDQSVFTLNGGSVNYLYPSGGTANVTGGEAFAIAAELDSQVNITGGTTHFLVGYDATQIQIAGGVVDSLNVNDDALALISGGNIPNVYANGNALIDLSSGVVGDVRLRGNATMSMSGGTLDNISLFKNNVFAISGGDLTGGVFIYELSNALISGAGLSYSILGEWLPANHASGLVYSVSGFWNDGSATPFTFLVYSRTDAPTFTGDETLGTLSFQGVAAAPEPATLALLTLGVLLGAAYLRRRRS